MVHESSDVGLANAVGDAGVGEAAIGEAARDLNERLRRLGRRVATAESCTGGLVASALTESPGASETVEGGVVSYSYEAKTDLLGVSAERLREDGAVSESVARDMVIGVLRRFPHASCALAITGIAGPDGGTPVKPVGTVCFGWAIRPAEQAGGRSSGTGHDLVVYSATERFDGNRTRVRLAAGRHAIEVLSARLDQEAADRLPVG